ncbi:DUF4190 domain-containing protein [Gordonibacter sp.]|uniref:DUF4190 domain-containing protein n=1 Tax=Gordonibacter sp. TaxID=1968902 RepID=UPI002FC6062C
MSGNINEVSAGPEGSPQPQQPHDADAQPPAPAVPQQAAQPYQAQSPYARQPVVPGQPNPYGRLVPGYYPQPAAPSGKATAALVCGILAILFSASLLPGIILGIVAIVLASKAVKESGKNGKTTGGKVCGIVGIVFSVLAFLMYLIIGFGAIMYAASNADSISSSYLDTPRSSAPMTSEGDQKAEPAVQAELDKLKNKDTAVVQALAEKLDKGFKDSSNYSLTELGVDPASFAQWMLADFTYQLDGVYTYDDGTGSAYADVTVRDPYALATAFMEEAQAFVDSPEASTLDEAAMKIKLGELYQAAMNKSTAMTDNYVSFDLVQKDGAWAVDQDSWASEVDYLFGIY